MDNELSLADLITKAEHGQPLDSYEAHRMGKALSDALALLKEQQTEPDLTMIEDRVMRLAVDAYHRAEGGHWFKLQAVVRALDPGSSPDLAEAGSAFAFTVGRALGLLDKTGLPDRLVSDLRHDTKFRAYTQVLCDHLDLLLEEASRGPQT